MLTIYLVGMAQIPLINPTAYERNVSDNESTIESFRTWDRIAIQFSSQTRNPRKGHRLVIARVSFSDSYTGHAQTLYALIDGCPGKTGTALFRRKRTSRKR